MHDNPYSSTNRHYVPDPMGRLGQGHWDDGTPRDPFGRLPGTPSPEVRPNTDNPFALGAAVGEQGPNKRDDVAKVETLLGQSGHMDLKATGGPTGYPGMRLVDGIKSYQKANGLKVDGYLNPNGETMASFKSTLSAPAGQGTGIAPQPKDTGYPQTSGKPVADSAQKPGGTQTAFLPALAPAAVETSPYWLPPLLGALGFAASQQARTVSVPKMPDTPPSTPTAGPAGQATQPAGRPSDGWTPPAVPGREQAAKPSDVPGFPGQASPELAPSIHYADEVGPFNLGAGEKAHPGAYDAVDKIKHPAVRDVVLKDVLGSGVNTHGDDKHTEIKAFGGFGAAKRDYDRIKKTLGVPDDAPANSPSGTRKMTIGNTTIVVRPISNEGSSTLDVQIKDENTGKINTIKKRYP